MQRLIALSVIAIALTPNTHAKGAELGLGDYKPNSSSRAQNFDGSYVDQPVEVSERKNSRNTEKVMSYMARVGIDGAGVKKVTNFVNDHIQDDKFTVEAGQYRGFKMELSHDVTMPSLNKFQMRFTNEDMPHWNITGTTRGVTLNYKYEW